MHRPSSPPVHLLPASEDDIPSLIRVHMAAFSNDNAARLMFKNKDENIAMLLDMLKAQLSNTKFAVTKAISNDTGNVLGWQACRFLGKDDDLESKGVVTGSQGVKDVTVNGSDGVRTLRSVLMENSVRVQKDWMANQEYIHFDTLVVDPAAQGRGIGTALLRRVTDKADEYSTYCWLQSSPAAHNIYLKAGFKDVASFEVHLKEFAPGGMEGGWGWGMYNPKYMLRLPGSSSSMYSE